MKMRALGVTATAWLVLASGAAAQTEAPAKPADAPAPSSAPTPPPAAPKAEPADYSKIADLIVLNDKGEPDVKEVVGGLKFTEGPLWRSAEGDLLVCDLSGNAMYRWKPGMEKAEEFWKPSDVAAGATLDREGRLLTAHFAGKIVRTETDGTRTVLADKFEGKLLNSPNDLVCREDGTVYFTDPGFGLRDRESELGFFGVFRMTPAGELSVVSKQVKTPNGITLSPDGKTLYATDYNPPKIWAWELDEAGAPKGEGKVLIDMAKVSGGKRGAADGMKVDRRGNIYCTGPGGVWVITPTGEHLGTIPTSGQASNVGWGGADGKTLYITRGPRVMAVEAKVGGELAGPKGK